MGLAASQARFLGITLRKANCEFKSTELAQQKLELTNQMTDISQEYSNALNATKLIWHNEMACDSFGNPMDMGLSYGLLMMPSVANDYNPYMVSSRSGAIVLNAKFADAARLAGISMAGGIPSEEGRNKFIKALANQLVFADPNDAYAKGDKNNNLITKTTCAILTDENPVKDVGWHSSAGMGAVPKDKGVASITTLDDLIDDPNIGKMSIDWLQIGRGLLNLNFDEVTTQTQSENSELTQSYLDKIADAKLNYYNNASGQYEITVGNVANLASTAEELAVKVIDKFKTVTDATKIDELKTYCTNYSNIGTEEVRKSGPEDVVFDMLGRFAVLDAKIKYAQTDAQKLSYIKELENLKKGLDKNGNEITTTSANTVFGDNELKYPTGTDSSGSMTFGTYDPKYAFSVVWNVYQKIKTENLASGNTIGWADSTNASSYGTTVDISALFQTNKSELASGDYQLSGNTNTINKLTIVQNDTITYSPEEIKTMTMTDLLNSNVVLMSRGSNSIHSVSVAGSSIMDYIASLFGYGHIGTGLNIDETSDQALTLALEMVKKKFLKEGNAVQSGNKTSNTAMLNNSAYLNANDFNRIGATKGGDYAGLNLSNMVSAFLTYYDNFLRGSESGYVVGKGNTDGKTLFVTDDANYAYVMNTPEEISNDEKVADFYNQLYNNICEHGWRYDDMVIDNEYLESAVKDGRYQIMSLNSDGYFYQERYNNLPYMEEVKDQDAIARAEASFTTKKAQITYKEDQIDIKTKKLDAEISELNTEINSVQNIISKTIEKTFSLFSN